jgi:hypothetical protein
VAFYAAQADQLRCSPAPPLRAHQLVALVTNPDLLP